MKVVIDSQIPFIKGILEPFARVSYLAGSQISREHLVDADALIIRTRTRINSQLLQDTAIKFVGSATIGTDHIDRDWCSRNGICFVSAPGCNSGSVMQYIASALAELQLYHKFKSDNTTLGIIGVGNVGKKVAHLAETLGFRVLLNDPPRERKEGGQGFVSLDHLLAESDIVTVHVPLTMEGRDKTLGLLGSNIHGKAKEGVIIINTSRGGVVDEQILLNMLKSGRVKSTVVDVWQNEPRVNMELVEHSFLATPHIAGYSVDGKLKGAEMILDELCKFFNLQADLDPGINVPAATDTEIDFDKFTGNDIEKVLGLLLQIYPIRKDHSSFFSSPGKFEDLRNNYGIRREYHNYTVRGSSVTVLDILGRLGFKTRKH